MRRFRRPSTTGTDCSRRVRVRTITTADAGGQVNAASFGTCTRVSHAPVTLAFAVGAGKDTFDNVLETGEFVVNLGASDRLSWSRFGSWD